MKKTAKVMQKTIYEEIGGAKGVEKLVNTFCDVLETTEVGKPIYLLHLRGHGMPHTRIEQFNFFSGMFGGPKLYSEKWGHSDIRKIHEHVPISNKNKDAWLTCMKMTMQKLDYSEQLQNRLIQHFTQMALLVVKH